MDRCRDEWHRKLKLYERNKSKAKYPDRYQNCINALVELGKSKGWM